MSITRQHLPTLRRGWTRKVYVGGQKLYVCCNEYPDGRPGEIFLTAAKTGALVQAMLSGWAIAISAQLQYGISLDSIVSSYENTKFDPCGVVQGDDDIKQASSLFDYIVKRLKLTYLQDVRGEVMPATSQPATPPPEPQTRLQRIAQETADKWGTAAVIVLQPPPSRIGDDPKIPYVVLESRATKEELAAAVERVLPKQA